MAENAESRQRIGVLEADVVEARQETADVRRELADVRASKEAENADLRQEIADVRASSNAQNAELRQQLAEMKAENDERAARQERLEHLLADSGRLPGPESGQARPDQQVTLAENQELAEAAIAEREGTHQSANTRDVDQPVWRRMTSAENLGLAQTVGDAVVTVREVAMHAPSDGRVILGLTALGLAAALKARAEKRAERSGKERHDRSD
jgi:hypothetical protein